MSHEPEFPGSGVGLGIALTVVMFAGAIGYNAWQDRRPADVCTATTSGGVNVTQTEMRRNGLGDVKQTFKISADATGKMNVALMEPSMATYDLISNPPKTERWQDTVMGTQDNLLGDHQEARSLVSQCASDQGVKLTSKDGSYTPRRRKHSAVMVALKQ